MESEMRRRMAHDKVTRRLFEIVDDTKNSFSEQCYAEKTSENP